jgi:WD40 repeat protein
VVTLWDVSTTQELSEYEAHEKRIWSVDFCRADPCLFVSGSDDGCVKVLTWSSPGRGGARLPSLDSERAVMCCAVRVVLPSLDSEHAAVHVVLMPANGVLLTGVVHEGGRKRSADRHEGKRVLRQVQPVVSVRDRRRLCRP